MIKNRDFHRELSYRLIGIAMKVHASYGSMHKEIIYQRALAENLSLVDIHFLQQPKLRVLSSQTGNVLGWYQPDFLIQNAIILELKATPYPIKIHEVQLRDYLKCSKIELGYVLNFGSPSLYFKRILYTNDQKLHIASAGNM